MTRRAVPHVPGVSNQQRYMISTFGKSLPWSAADAFGLFFLTEVLDVAPDTAGWIVLVLFLWAALCDPVAGWVSDRLLRVRKPRRRSFLVSTTLMAAAFALSFSAMPLAPPFALAAVVTAGLVFRAAYALLDVPHNAFMANMAHEIGNPALTGALRLTATIVASWTAILLAGQVLAASNSAAPLAFAAYGLAMGTGGGVLFCAFLPKPGSDTPAGRETAEARPLENHDGAPPWRPVVFLFASAILATLVSGIFTKDLVYVSKYVFNDPGWTTVAMSAFTAGKLLGVPLWLLAAQHRQTRGLLVSAYALAATFSMLALVLTPAKLSFAAMLLLLGLGLGGANMLGWSALAEVVGSHAALQAQSGKIYGLYTASSKLASGLSGLMLGLCLDWLDVVSGAHNAAANFYQLAFLVPSIGCLLALVFAWKSQPARLRRK
jgi:GPH family glycoside/pentoside/hexuronide:cation symporter